MKNILIFFCTFFLFSGILSAQDVPSGMHYQAIARDSEGIPIANKEMDVEIVLFTADPVERAYYTEYHQTRSNQFGLINLTIGKGEALDGSFQSIPWRTQEVWIKISSKTSNQKEFTIVTANKLHSVPYAFYAAEAGSLSPYSRGGQNPGFNDFWALSGNDYFANQPPRLGTKTKIDLNLITDDVERMKISHKGDITMHEKVWHEENATFKKDIIVENDANIQNDLNIYQNVDLNTMGGKTHIYGFTQIDGNAEFGGPLGNSSMFMGPVQVRGKFSAYGGVDIKSDLDVTGVTSLYNTFNVFNNATSNLTGPLNVDGITNLNNHLFVNNASTTTLSGQLIVDGRTDLNNTFYVNNASVSNLSGVLNVDGVSNHNNTFNVNNASVSNLSGVLNVTGVSNQNSTFNVNNASVSNLSGVLNVAGISNLNNTLNVNNGNTSNLSGALNVGGLTGLNGQVTINASLGGGESSYGAYPLRVQGSGQGLAIKLTAGTPNNSNNFITFFNSSGGAVGRIEGETLGEATSTPEFIFDNSILVAEEIAAGVNVGLAAIPIVVGGLGASTGPCGPCLAIAAADLIVKTANITAYNVFATQNLGVTYQSGSADYAEWLERMDPNERIFAGDIVGVTGGKISKYTGNAQQYLVISTKPAVLGNMPDATEEELYEKVAFMGQIPVKVRGFVLTGDYILPSGLNDGTGIAVSPDKITAKQYREIVGVAWSNTYIEDGLNRVNMAIGLNANDVANLAIQQEQKLKEMEARLVKLEASFLALENKNSKDSDEAVVQSDTDRIPADADQAMSREELLLASMPPELSDDIMEEAMLNIKNSYEKQGIDYMLHPGLKKLFTDAAYKAEVLKKAKATYKMSYEHLQEAAKKG